MARRVRARPDAAAATTLVEAIAPEETSVGTITLQVESGDERRVTWDEEVIDNENMDKKKSKSRSCLAGFIVTEER